MQVFDASSIVYGWDNYPLEIFPRLWDVLAGMITNGEITMSQVCFEEVEHVSPDCAAWLHDQGITRHAVGNEIVNAAMAIKANLGIAGDAYHADGVDENDVIAIATSKVLGVAIVSDEARQPNLPANIKRYKIPAVCDMQAVQVDCVGFLDFIKGLNQIFG
jgi:hypothetical protein